MSLGHPLDALSARWAEDPHPTACAALADGLRKRGDLQGAVVLVRKGTDRFPGHLPLWLTAAHLAVAMEDSSGVEEALRRALAIDVSHPVVRELADEHAPQLLQHQEDAESLYFTDPEPEVPDSDGDALPAPPELVTESLAALYHRQGHLAQALAAYSELVARDPANTTVAARHEAVRDELAAMRPLPFDARESGGRATGAWLAHLASLGPVRPRPAAFDAFYDAPPSTPEPAADFGAFQRWLEELDK